MLFVVATPIGNLSDFSLRAQEILQSVDYILCEDTRTSAVLLSRYEIKKPLKSFHKFNEAKAEELVLADLKNGLKVALISDAGTPGICDPGERLIKVCIDNEIEVTPIPGPCALILALTLSGFDTTPFQFTGFLPKKASEYKAQLSSMLSYPGTSLFYETPHRLLDLLEMLPPNRQLSISRELTKKFEETKRGTASELKIWFESNPPRGEFVVAIKAGTDTLPPPLTLEEEFQKLKASGLTQNEIIKQLSQSFKITKREVSKQLANS